MPAVVPQHAVRGITVGMTRGAVVARLGRPAHVRHGTSDLGPYTELRYRGLRITFAFDAGVSQLETTTPRDRTRSGVGVGSTEAALRAGVPNLRCATESAVRHCTLGRFAAGKIVTDFFLHAGRVTRIVLGRVLD